MEKLSFRCKPCLRILFWLVLTIFFSCENPLLFNHCPDCYHTEPLNAEIRAKLTPYSTQGMPTTIRIYDGKLEDGIVIGTYEGTYNEFRLSVKVNKVYTVTATYYRYGTFYTGVDAVNPRVRYEKVLCDQPCYLIIDNELDLRIKGL